jgi:hypothetical protein
MIGLDADERPALLEVKGSEGNSTHKRRFRSISNLSIVEMWRDELQVNCG